MMGQHKLPHHLRKARPAEKVHVSRVPSTVAADEVPTPRLLGNLTRRLPSADLFGHRSLAPTSPHTARPRRYMLS